MKKKIKGVGVNLDSPDIASVKTVAQLKKLDMFSHLSDVEQSDAIKELAKELGLKEKPSPPVEN